MCRIRDGLYYVMCQSYRKISELIFAGLWEDILEIKPCSECRSLFLHIIKKPYFTLEMYHAVAHLTPINDKTMWDILYHTRDSDTFLFFLDYTTPDMVCSRGVLLDLCRDPLNNFYPEIVDALLRYGVCLDLQDSSGNTTLHKLAREKNITGYRYLVEKGADEDLANREGWSPRELLLKMTHT